MKNRTYSHYFPYILLCIILIFSFTNGKANGTLIERDISIDLESDWNYGKISVWPDHDAWEGKVNIDDIIIKEGDILNINIKFKNKKALQLSHVDGARDYELTKFSMLTPNDNTTVSYVAKGQYKYFLVGGDLLCNDIHFMVSGGGGMIQAPFNRKNLTDTSFLYTGINIKTKFTFYEVNSGSGIFDQIEWSSAAGDVQIVPAPIPEPTTMLLFGTGVLSLVGFGRNKFFKRT